MVYPGRFGRGMILQGVKLIAAASANGSFQVNPTLAAGDVKAEKDGGASTNLGTLPAVTPASGTSVKVTLSDAEMEALQVVVNFIDQTGTKEWADTFFVVDTQIGYERANKCQAGGSTTTAVLDTGASDQDDEYNTLCVRFYHRTQDLYHDALFTDYVGTTRTGTFVPACPFTIDADVIYEIAARSAANLVAFNGAEPEEDDLPLVDGSGHVTLADGSLTAAKIASDAITAAKIASGAVTSAKFAAGAIDAAAIADNAIDAGAIASDAIAAAKIATGAITSAKFAAGAINAAAIADDAIDAGAIASNAITAAKIATGAITNAKFAAGAIDAAAIADGAIDAGSIASGAITGAKFAAFSDIAAVPTAGVSTIWTGIEWLINRSISGGTQTASQQTQKNAAGSTIGTASVSDDGTTFTRGIFT